MDLRLRLATMQDYEFVFETRKAAFRSYVEMASGWDETEQRRLHQERFASQAFHVIDDGGIDVGILSFDREMDCIKVNQLFILPEHQQKGVGAACMGHVIAEAKAAGLPVRLQVLHVNPRAMVFYHRLGFRPIGSSASHVVMER